MKVVDEETLELVEVAENKKDDAMRAQIRSTLNCKPEEFFEKYTAYKKAEAEFKELFEPFKDQLLKLYKDIPEMPKNVVVGGVKVSYVSPSTRTSIDTKKLKEEEPELVKKFSKVSNVAATIRLEGI